MKRLDLTGQRFDRLLVIDKYGKKCKNRDIYWNCQCDCGNIITTKASRLINGMSKSCGCYRKAIIQNRQTTIDDYEKALESKYRAYKWAADYRNIYFDLSLNDALELLSGDCFYCGIEPTQKIHYLKNNFYYNGIDRVNNDIGYINSNCVSCCGQCNTAKFTNTLDEFIIWVNRVHNNMRQKELL